MLHCGHQAQRLPQGTASMSHLLHCQIDFSCVCHSCNLTLMLLYLQTEVCCCKFTLASVAAVAVVFHLVLPHCHKT